MKKVTIFWLFTLVAMLFFNCKDQQIEAPSTGIVLTVQDVGGTLVSGAEVFLFDSKKDFEAFGNSLGQSELLDSYIMTTTTNGDGEASFTGLDNKIYWFYVQKGNTNNFKSQFKLPSELTEKADTYILITLEQFVTERVQFYTTDPSVANNPITIFADEDGSFNQTSGFVLDGVASLVSGSSPDLKDLESTIVFNPKFSTTTFYIKNENGCVWQKNIELNPEEPSVQIELEPCSVGLIRFSSDINVSIELNNGEQVGSVNSSTLDVYRPLGTSYSFKATNSDETCSWIGTVEPKEASEFVASDVVELTDLDCN